MRIRALVPICVALALAVAAPAQAADQITVSPQAGTPDATPTTDISFLGAKADDLAGLSVIGSRTGAHTGRLVAYASATGESFVPTKPFADGEQVTVGAPRAGVNYRFGVAATAPSSPPLVSAAGGTIGSTGGWNFQSTSLHPAAMRILKNLSATAPGDIFMAPIRAPQASGPFAGQVGPTILDSNGNPIWVHPESHGVWAMNFHPQTYHGAPVLTWWAGHVTNQGIGFGYDAIVNSQYQPVKTLKNPNGFQPDLHEFTISPSGAAFITSYRAVRRDLTPWGGHRNDMVYDSVVQEVDIATGHVMFEWHPLNHISPGDSYTVPVPNFIWDPYHINSVDVDKSGNLLITARNTWAVYNVKLRNGKISWTLGGKHSNFHLGPGVAFAWEHDARWVSSGRISLFGNAGTGNLSRALIVHFDAQHHAATLLHQYSHPGVAAGSQGNMQVLPNGNVFIGWGAAPFISEYSASGQLLFDARFHGPDESYRAFRSPWTAQPATLPSIAAQGQTVYTSWNGATTVAKWQVLAGSSPGSLAPAGSATRDGFETAINSSSTGPYYAVEALDSGGNVLATSPVVKSS